MGAFDDAAVATIRKPVARATIHWSGVLVDPTIVSSSQKADIHNRYTFLLDQVSDNVTAIPKKWFQCDNTTPLNTMFLAPGTETEAAIYQFGWWGNDVSDGSGNFSTPQIVDLVTPTRPVSFLGVYGDSAYGEYPVDFTVKLYTDGVILAHTETVTGNTSVNWETYITVLAEVVKVELSITKWSATGAVSKIAELAASTIEVYDGDTIISANLLEESELKDATIPTGNISSNELELSLQNVTDLFYPGNTDSPYHAAIKKNRKIIFELGFDIDGVGIEYLAMGTFWSKDWKTGESSPEATTTALDRMGLLQDTVFAGTEVILNTTIGDLAEIVLEDAVLLFPDLTYNIDTALYGSDYSIPVGAVGEMSHFNALKLLSEACIGRVYCDHDDVIQFKTFAVPKSYDYELTADDYFERSIVGASEEVANKIIVNTQPLTSSAGENVYTSEVLTLTAGSSETYEIKYKESPSASNVATVAATGGSSFVGSVSAATYTAYGASVTVNCTTAGDFKISVTGTLYSVEGERAITAQDADSIFEYGESTFTLVKNNLIQSDTLAAVIAAALLVAFKDPYKDIELDWRGNPSIGLDTVIRAPRYVKGSVSVKGDYNIFKSKLKFDGSLSGVLSGRKLDAYENAALEWQNMGDNVSQEYQNMGDNSSTILQGVP